MSPQALQNQSCDQFKGMAESSHHINMSDSQRWMSLVGGGLLGLWALSRSRPAAAVGLLGGAAMIYRGVTGHCNLMQALGVDSSEGARQLRACFKREHDHRWQDGIGRHESHHQRSRVDEVQDASEDSFPASDPPSWTAGRSTLASGV